MGTALLSGIIKATEDSPHELRFSASVHSQESLEQLKQTFSAHKDRVDHISTDNVQAARSADVVILAFPPRQLPEILNSCNLAEVIQGKLIVSIIAGVTTEELNRMLRGSSQSTQFGRISRVIPTIGAQINESMSLIADTALSLPDRDLVTWLFRQVGQTQFMPEKLINTVTAVGAACHALTVVAVDAIVDGSVAEGVPRPQALEVAAQCLRSSSTLLQGKMTIEGLKASMSIAEGITINALLQLDRGHVRSGISDAVRHAVQYANK